MSKDQPKTNEVAPTYLRLAKVFWSLFWRIFLILLGIGIVMIPIYIFFVGLMNLSLDSLSPLDTFLIYLPITYVFQCIGFRLVLGNRYSDFTLDFFPKRDRKTPGFWPSIFYISWAYTWRVSIISGILHFGKLLLPDLLSKSTVFEIYAFIGEILIGIFLLRFVINKQYGEVRLSLLEKSTEENS